MPLRWEEVNARLRLGRFTIKTAVGRMRKLGDDPTWPVLTETADLAAALEALTRHFGAVAP